MGKAFDEKKNYIRQHKFTVRKYFISKQIIKLKELINSILSYFGHAEITFKLKDLKETRK